MEAHDLAWRKQSRLGRDMSTAGLEVDLRMPSAGGGFAGLSAHRRALSREAPGPRLPDSLRQWREERLSRPRT